MVCDRAMVDASHAWEDALKLRSFELDQAISQSQVLFFAATMEDFQPPTSEAESSVTDDSKQDESKGDTESSSFCSANPGCATLGLVGNCCPNTGGMQLGCCSSNMDQTPNSGSTSTETTSASASQSCSSHKACVAIGLTGQCCPAAGGVRLGCCDETS